jgi:peroxiredoxin
MKPENKVYLVSYAGRNPMVIDSTVLTNSGEFKFKESTKGPTFYKIVIDQNEFLLIAKNGDRINIKADLSDLKNQYTLTGSNESIKLQELNIRKDAYNNRIAKITQDFQGIIGTKKPSDELMFHKNIERENEALESFILNFANNNSELLAGFFAISALDPQKYEAELISYSNKIKSSFNENSAVTEFLIKMALLKSVQVGQPAPEFTIMSIDNTPISLSDFKGKYLLLDFWASWCMPCRQENPNVVEAYKQFRNKNFTVFGISLDKDKEAWEYAVANDKLFWSHGSDLNDFEGKTVSLYQVESIPSSFIIDPNGKIIAKNLKGDDLLKFLSDNLPHK